MLDRQAKGLASHALVRQKPLHPLYIEIIDHPRGILVAFQHFDASARQYSDQERFAPASIHAETNVAPAHSSKAQRQPSHQEKVGDLAEENMMLPIGYIDRND